MTWGSSAERRYSCCDGGHRSFLFLWSSAHSLQTCAHLESTVFVLWCGSDGDVTHTCFQHSVVLHMTRSLPDQHRSRLLCRLWTWFTAVTLTNPNSSEKQVNIVTIIQRWFNRRFSGVNNKQSQCVCVISLLKSIHNAWLIKYDWPTSAKLI